MTEQELLDLKQKIETSKENLSKMEGRKEALMDQLLQKFGIKTIAEAKRKIKKLEEDVAEWDQKIEDATVELENKMNEEQDTGSAEPPRTRERSRNPSTEGYSGSGGSTSRRST
jgi:hypothetical protein